MSYFRIVLALSLVVHVTPSNILQQQIVGLRDIALDIVRLYPSNKLKCTCSCISFNIEGIADELEGRFLYNDFMHLHVVFQY